jgi:hypothetical protein
MLVTHTCFLQYLNDFKTLIQCQHLYWCTRIAQFPTYQKIAIGNIIKKIALVHKDGITERLTSPFLKPRRNAFYPSDANTDVQHTPYILCFANLSSSCGHTYQKHINWDEVVGKLIIKCICAVCTHPNTTQKRAHMKVHNKHQALNFISLENLQHQI